MRVYIIQHAHAIPRADNPPVRTLSDTGIEETRRLANILNGDGATVHRIMHVGTDWTKDNAEKLAKFLESDARVIQTPYPLTKDGSLDAFIDDLFTTSDDVAIAAPADVAMRSVTRLLTGREEPLIPAKSSGLCSCLERRDDDTWMLLWMVRPEHLPSV